MGDQGIILLLSKSNNRECHQEEWRSVQKEAGSWETGSGSELTKCRTGFPRRLMRGNPENHCQASLMSILSKIIGQMCPEKSVSIQEIMEQ